jgi:hypothetical protein
MTILAFMLLMGQKSWAQIREFQTTRLNSTAGAGVASVLSTEAALLNPASSTFFSGSNLSYQSYSTSLRHESDTRNANADDFPRCGDVRERCADFLFQKRAKLFEEFIAEEAAAGRFKPALREISAKRALLHGHCHQKAFGAMDATRRVLAMVPGLEVQVVESSCCGMAGSFGYEDSHYAVSMQMAELSLLPKLRESSPSTLIVADGTSCRHQIRDGVAREAQHVARVLAAALA